MKKLTSSVFLSCAIFSCASNSVTFESVRLADIMITANWSTFQSLLPIIQQSAQNKLKKSGASDHTAKIFSDEFGDSMSKENLSKIYALVITQHFSEHEQKELGEFLQSPLGIKYLEFGDEILKNPKLLKPILSQACKTTKQRVSSAEYKKISRECGNL